MGLNNSKQENGASKADPTSDTKFQDIDRFPSNKDLAATVMELPQGVGGKRLCPDALPSVTEAGQLAQFSITYPKFDIRAKKNCYSVMDGDSEPYADGVYLSVSNEKSKVLHNKTRIIVRDKEGNPLVLAAQQPREALTTYFILSKTPLHEGDEKVDTEDGVDFYPMFKVRNIDNEEYGRKVSVWKGPNYEDMLHVERVPAKGAGHKALMVVDPNDSSKVYGVVVKKPIKERIETKRAGWDCLLAPGTDVGMMLALCAVLEDMVGWFSEFRAAA